MQNRLLLLRVILSTVILFPATGRAAEGDSGDRDNRAGYAHATRRPLLPTEVEITGGPLHDWVKRSRDVGTLDHLQKFEEAGYIENFRIAARGEKKPHKYWANCNEFVHKLIEAGGYYAADSPKIRTRFEALLDDVIACQRPDGYLNSFYTNPIVVEKGGKPFQPMNRFEFYNFGHFTQAAISWYRTTGDRKPLDAAIRFADLLCDKFSAPKLLPYTRNRDNRPNLKYEHPNHELAMVELYRVTGRKRYLEFAKHTLDQYEFWKFPEIWGHAVQETLLMAAAADVYIEYGTPEMKTTLDRIWHDMRQRKMYITGAVGSRAHGESYGAAYELPNRGSYAETCASITNMFFSYRMLLATGEARYADCLERALYGGVLSGYSLSGKDYFYRNPLETPTGMKRKPFFGCACCPPNIHRLLGSLDTYIYSVGEEGVAVDLFAQSRATVTLAGEANTKVTLTQTTNYPIDGKVQIAVDPTSPGEFALRVRIPGWLRAAGGEDALYRPLDGKSYIDAVRFRIEGEPIKVTHEKGYAVIRRSWKQGDVVSLDLPMPVRPIGAHAKVEANRGRIALMRGPVVYCLEACDNPSGVLHLVVSPKGPFKSTCRPDWLGGAVEVRGPAESLSIDAQGNVVAKPVTFRAVPYYLWSNRKQGGMTVWPASTRDAAL